MLLLVLTTKLMYSPNSASIGLPTSNIPYCMMLQALTMVVTGDYMGSLVPSLSLQLFVTCSMGKRSERLENLITRYCGTVSYPLLHE